MAAESNSSKDQVYLWSGLLLYLGHQGRNNNWHSHYAASLLISPDSPMTLETRQQRIECQIALLPPNTEHRLDTGSRLLVAMCDPDGPFYAPLATLDINEVWVSSDNPKALQQTDALFQTLPHATQAQRQVKDIIQSITGQRPTAQGSNLDPRIRQVLKTIRQAMPDEVPLEQLAEAADLSTSRLQHLFKEQLGLPMRQCLLWNRLFESLRLWSEGKTLADAAHEAGFYDQPHYTRTMRRMIDAAPSEFANNPDLVIHHAWRDEAGPREE